MSFSIIVWTGRPGQYKVSRQSPKKLKNNMNHQSTNLITDSSLLHSRSICRSDLMTSVRKYVRTSDGGLSAETSDSECIQSSSTSRRTIQSDRFDISKTTAEHHINYVPEYDVSQKLENFVVNSTPRQLVKSKSLATTSARWWWCLTFIFQREKSASIMYVMTCLG